MAKTSDSPVQDPSMSSNQLIRELENATCELLAAADSDLDRVQKVLKCRAAILARIAASEPGSFTAGELKSLRAAAQKGEQALEKLTMLRSAAAADWHKMNQLRSALSKPASSTVSISG